MAEPQPQKIRWPVLDGEDRPDGFPRLHELLPILENLPEPQPKLLPFVSISEALDLGNVQDVVAHPGKVVLRLAARGLARAEARLDEELAEPIQGASVATGCSIMHREVEIQNRPALRAGVLVGRSKRTTDLPPGHRFRGMLVAEESIEAIDPVANLHLKIQGHDDKSMLERLSTTRSAAEKSRVRLTVVGTATQIAPAAFAAVVP